MAREYLAVCKFGTDDVVRCEVLEQDAKWMAPLDDRLPHYTLVVRPDTGEIVLASTLFGQTLIAVYDPQEERHEREWSALAALQSRYLNRSG